MTELGRILKELAEAQPTDRRKNVLAFMRILIEMTQKRITKKEADA